MYTQCVCDVGSLFHWYFCINAENQCKIARDNVTREKWKWASVMEHNGKKFTNRLIEIFFFFRLALASNYFSSYISQLFIIFDYKSSLVSLELFDLW